MKTLIVEDVTLVAERIADLVKTYLPDCTTKIAHSLYDAKFCINEEVYDLLLLDLNLNGKDGFELLKFAVAASFQTIVITANKDQASQAFDHGILDFISKPISEKRFKIAIDRFLSNDNMNRENLKSLSIKSKGVIELIQIDEIEYIKASGNYSEIYTLSEKQYLHDKNLDKLLRILPKNFIRVHRSYIIPKEGILKVIKHGGGKYDIELKSGFHIPLSREIYKQYFLK